MRRLFSFAVLGGAAWWLLGRRRPVDRRGATIGYADGSSVTLEAGTPELDRLLEVAGRTQGT